MSAARGRRLARRTLTSLLLLAGVLAAPLALGPVAGPLSGVTVAPVPVVPREAASEPTPARPASPEGPTGLQVDGNRLLKDGALFVPRGFNMIGLLTPQWCERPPGIAARAHFGPAELAAAKAWGADTLRFQVSQRGLADRAVPQPERDAYLTRVLSGIDQARRAGFVVIVSMQDQRYGCGSIHPLPSAETVAAWDRLVPWLRADPYVMLELFNEPQNENDAPGWAQWRDGGPGPNENLGAPAVGHQQLLEHLRDAGSRNVLIADTARLAKRTTGLPFLADPQQAVVYAIHPYSFDSERAWWDRHFGDLAATVPVVATEWNHLGEDCGTAKERLAAEFLEYLEAHRIGVLGHAFDVPGTVVADWAWTPTACGSPIGGSGRVLRNFFDRPPVTD
jgi:hypothetical protein